MMFGIVLVAIFAILFYYFLLKRPTFWCQYGVKTASDDSILVSLYGFVKQAMCFCHMTEKIYNTHKDVRYVGFYQVGKPVLMIKDPELIKQIGIKDAHIFQDHNIFSRDDIDPLWSKNLFSSKGEKWRQMRPTLSPSFTSSKMKTMFTLISDCAESFIKYLLEQDEDIITLELKDAFTRFTNDVIATCAFGVTCDSQRERDNEFYLKGVDASDFSGLKGLKFLGFAISETTMKFFKISIFSEATGNFFRRLIKDTIKVREEQGIIRPDMIHLLLEARKKKPDFEISDEDITAQALIFFLAGFDTSSTLMLYIAYELAVNTDIQDRLREEVDDTLKECDGNVTYEALMKMKYLDMITSETLRKWPPSVISDRVAEKEYTIEATRPDERDVVIPKGSVIWFPLYAIQRDPLHYPDPEKFDPERFSDENKNKINPGTNISFGVGPRNCIGSRFALMENKLIIFHILTHFEIVPVKKTVIPVVLSKKHFNMAPEGGMWLGLKRRATTTK